MSMPILRLKSSTPLEILNLFSSLLAEEQASLAQCSLVCRGLGTRRGFKFTKTKDARGR